MLLAVGDSHWSLSSSTVTGITYNSVAMTYIRTDTDTTYYTWRSTLYYLIAPATGAHTVAVTYSSSIQTGGGGAISLTGCKQSGQPDAHNGAHAWSSKPATVDVTTVADNCWVVDVLGATGSPTCVNTQRWKITGAQYFWAGADTNSPKHPAGAQTMSWTFASNATWVLSAASFAPAADSYDISNTPSTENLGIVVVNTTYYAYGSAPSNPVEDDECTFTVTNNGAGAIDLDMKIADFTGGVGWNIDATPEANEVKLTAYYSGQDPASGLVLTNSDQEFYDGLAGSATKKWDFALLTGTSFTDGVAKSGTLTITATAED